MDTLTGIAPNECCPGFFQAVPLTGETRPYDDTQIAWVVAPGTVCANCGASLSLLLADKEPPTMPAALLTLEVVEPLQTA